MVHPIKFGCSELVKRKYNIRRDWVGNVIHWELSKGLRFEYTRKWYMHKPESVHKNEKQKMV